MYKTKACPQKDEDEEEEGEEEEDKKEKDNFSLTNRWLYCNYWYTIDHNYIQSTYQSVIISVNERLANCREDAEKMQRRSKWRRRKGLDFEQNDGQAYPLVCLFIHFIVSSKQRLVLKWFWTKWNWFVKQRQSIT